jgi:hypothetical protein
MADKTANADKGRAEASAPAHVQRLVPEMTREPDYAPPWMTMYGAPFVIGSEGVRRAAGNMAVQRHLRAGVIQAKLKIDQPGDPDEREADRVADSIISSHRAVNVQRKCSACAAGATCSKCQDEQLHAKLQPGRGASHSHESGASSVHAALRSAGRPLDSAARAFFEPRFAADFRGVRVHTGGEAAHAARSIGARAFTAGSDVVFADGEYAPESTEGQRLLAHELTHVVQQGETAHAPRVQRQTPDAPASGGNAAPDTGGAAPPAGQATGAAPTALIVEDSAKDTEPQQLRRGQFLSESRSASSAAAEDAMAGSLWAPLMRPQVNQRLESYFGVYSGQDAATLEQTVRQQVPGAGGATSASAFVPLIAGQVRTSVADGMPKDDTGKGILDAGAAAISGIAQTVRDKLADIGSIFFKAGPGGARRDADPRVVKTALGEGQGLSGGVRSRMESAFGQDFSRVRVHTGTRAAALSAGLGARAFTVGTDIAFAASEYSPGTPFGDALMAHELAHVAQQRGAVEGRGGVGALQTQAAHAHEAFEEDADNAAVGAVASLWAGTKDVLAAVGRNAMPSLRTGLRLQRCTEKEPTREEMGKKLGAKMKEVNKNHSLDSGVWYWPSYREACEADTSGTHKWDEAKYRTGYTAAPQFTKVGTFKWRLNDGESASSAIQAWLKGLTVAECASTATALYYDTLRQTVGDSNFDRFFKAEGKRKNRLVVGIYPEELPIKEFLYEPELKDGLVEGDWYYWKNHPSYKYKHPAGLWQGENAIYIGRQGGKPDGERRWSGFGAQDIGETEMLKTLLSAYNAGRSDDDNKKLEEKKTGGQLPPEYRFPSEGGTLVEQVGKHVNKDEIDAEDTKALIAAGGGLQAKGWALHPAPVGALKKR